MNVDERCFAFRDSIRARLSYSEESDKDDMMYLHILDCIGALSHIQKTIGKVRLKTENRNKYNPVAESKRRIFWQAVRELADQELLLAAGSSEIYSAQYRVLDVFPDEAKRLDGRSWLPLHWAVTLPNTDIQDIENLIIARPEAVKVCVSSTGCNPIHLACMANARVEVLHLLQIHFPLLGKSVDPLSGSTPLHLAVRYSSSLALVQELIRLYPPALEMKDKSDSTPLHCVSANSSEGPQILQALLDAAPQTAQVVNCMDDLPLHRLLRSFPPVTPEMIAPLLEAYPDAVNIRDDIGYLPIHIAVGYASIQIFQTIAEENMDNLTVMMVDAHWDSVQSTSVAHIAVQCQELDILRYIQSVKPELLLLKDSADELPIRYLTIDDLTSPMSVASEILRFLLHHYRSIIPEKAVGSDPFGYRAFYRALSNVEKNKGLDLEEEEDLDLEEEGGLELDLQYPRRLLLLAGHPSLCLPEVLRDLNYSARRGALFLFFHHHHHHHHPYPFEDPLFSIFWRIRDGPGSKELIRAIIGFLDDIVLRGRNVSALIRPFRRNLSIATFTETKLFMGSNNINPLPALVKKVSSTNRNDRMDALETLRSIIGDADDDDGYLIETMGSNKLGLLPILVSIISMDDIIARDTALVILCWISSHSSNHMYMLSLDLGLVPILASLLSSDSSDSDDYKSQFYTLQILRFLYKIAYNRDNYSVYNIGSKDLGVLSGLVLALERNRSHHYDALNILEKQAKNPENILYMGSEELLDRKDGNMVSGRLTRNSPQFRLAKQILNQMWA